MPKVEKWIRLFRQSDLQTKIFFFMVFIYMTVLVWTTLQAYARLDYSRTGNPRPILIETTNKKNTP